MILSLVINVRRWNLVRIRWLAICYHLPDVSSMPTILLDVPNVNETNSAQNLERSLFLLGTSFVYWLMFTQEFVHTIIYNNYIPKSANIKPKLLSEGYRTQGRKTRGRRSRRRKTWGRRTQGRKFPKRLDTRAEVARAEVDPMTWAEVS